MRGCVLPLPALQVDLLSFGCLKLPELPVFAANLHPAAEVIKAGHL